MRVVVVVEPEHLALVERAAMEGQEVRALAAGTSMIWMYSPSLTSKLSALAILMRDIETRLGERLGQARPCLSRRGAARVMNTSTSDGGRLLPHKHRLGRAPRRPRRLGARP